jgi:hypothetical protein
MITDKFWKIFWIGAGSITLLGCSMALTLFMLNTRQGNLLAAIGVSYQDGKDPFQSTLLGIGSTATSTNYSLHDGFLYQDALPIGFRSWYWQAAADWRSLEDPHEGPYALKAFFATAGGTVGMSGPDVSLKDIHSLSLWVRADEQVGDVFLTVYDRVGNSLGVQSLGWYAQNGSLLPNSWAEVVIPLANIIGSSSATVMTGFSISGKNPGSASIDQIQLSKNEVTHDKWVPPPEPMGQPFNPFATSSPANLPYSFTPNPDQLSRWYSYFGYFGPGKNGEIIMGPLSASSTGSMTVFRGGRNWTDYAVDSVVNWGETRSLSLLGRFQDDGNFVACAYSHYGESAQIYQVKKGESTLISQSPALAIKDIEAWKGVQMGIKVRGNVVSCSINQQDVLKATLSDMPTSGTVGFETWDPDPTTSPHTLVSFMVTPLGAD